MGFLIDTFLFPSVVKLGPFSGDALAGFVAGNTTQPLPHMGSARVVCPREGPKKLFKRDFW